MVVRPRGVSSHSPLVADQGKGTSRLGLAATDNIGEARQTQTVSYCGCEEVSNWVAAHSTRRVYPASLNTPTSKI